MSRTREHPLLELRLLPVERQELITEPPSEDVPLVDDSPADHRQQFSPRLESGQEAIYELDRPTAGARLLLFIQRDRPSATEGLAPA